MTAYSNPYGFVPVAPPASPERPSVLPVVSLVLSALALAGVLVLTVVLGVSGAFGGGGDAPLTGQLSASRTGALQGEALAQTLTQVISTDGGDVSDLRCPDTPAVRQGVSTICHGTISGSAWAVAVFFEDDQGRFTALPM